MSEMILASLIIIIFPIYILFCCNNKTVQFMSVSQTNALKGFAIILTYIHHFGQIRYEVYNTHSFLGYLGVALFLFLAGYITNKQAELKKEKWSEKFWIKKIKRLIAPRIVIVFVFGFLAGRTILNNFIEVLEFSRDWFLTVILLSYLAFFIAKKYKKNPVIIVFGVELALVVACILSNQLIMWYNTAFLFGIGVFCSKYNEIIKGKINQKASVLMKFLFIVTFGICLFCSMMRYQRFIFDTIVGLMFVLLICVFVYKYRWYSRILDFIGKYSWEFYLVHTRVIGIILNRVTTNNLLAFIISFVVSLLISFTVNESLSYLYKIVDRCKGKNED